MEIDTATLKQWETNRQPKKPNKQWVLGWLFLVCLFVPVFLFLFYENGFFSRSLVLLIFLGLAMVFYGLGTAKYKKEAKRIRMEAEFCHVCSKKMEEHVTDMDKTRLDKKELTKIRLMHRFIIKDRLFETEEGRIYMTGKKNAAPGSGYAAWEPALFLLLAKWLACRDCRVSYIRDTVFQKVCANEKEIEQFLKNKKGIVEIVEL